MFSIIIPIYKLFELKKDYYELDKSIESVLDQDYKNYEIIVCVNGPIRERIRKHVEKTYHDIEALKIVVIDKANAAIARNAGADIATGEFYSFLSGDTYLKPGALTIWKQAFDDNPKASMVYSDIDYAKNGEYSGKRGYVPDYDRYAHECFNCIDGAMPCRSKYFEPWYPEVTALQDWAWSLGVTKHAPAVKIPDVCYMGELPKEGGLSDTFSKNWKKLNKQIRKIHGIPERKIVVTSVGAPFHALRTAKLFGADYLSPQLLGNDHDYDVVYLLGYYTNNLPIHNLVFSKCKVDCIRIIHWIGTDILQMMGLSWEANVNICDVLNEYVDIQLAECDITASELKRMQLNINTLPLPLDTTDYKFIVEKPKKFTVAVYVPGFEQLHYMKYNIQAILDIAKAMPDVKFLFFGVKGDIPDVALPNLEVRGWVDIKDVARDSTVLLRFTPHDGLPIGPVEFVMMGREALTSIPVPGARYIGSGRISEHTASRRKSEVIEAIRLVQKKPLSLKARKDNARQWKEKLAPATVKKTFDAFISQRLKQLKKQWKKIAEDKQKKKGKNNGKK